MLIRVIKVIAIVGALIVASLVGWAVFGPVVSDVSGSVGAVASDSANELKNLPGLGTVLLGLGLGAGLAVLSRMSYLRQRC